MSTILDALRRKSDDRDDEDNEYGHTARTDSVLAMLGYPRRGMSGGPGIGSWIVRGLIAVFVGFLLVVLGLWVVSLFESTPQPSGQQAAAPRPTLSTPPAEPVSPLKPTAPSTSGPPPAPATTTPPITSAPVTPPTEPMRRPPPRETMPTPSREPPKPES
ncbi:MAG TPA: hypothetical protein VGY57_11685, partial [Vicinamibacterales bacterium]|nr:hypothetical protein [Vicinamibacterales bacterium]